MLNRLGWEWDWYMRQAFLRSIGVALGFVLVMHLVGRAPTPEDVLEYFMVALCFLAGALYGLYWLVELLLWAGHLFWWTFFPPSDS